MDTVDLHRTFLAYKGQEVRVTFKDGINQSSGSHAGRLDSLTKMRDKIMVALGQPDTEQGGVIFFVNDHENSELFVETE